MSAEGDYLRKLADLFDNPDVLLAMCNRVISSQQERIDKLEDLCSDLYRIAAHEGYIGNELHNRLVELGFAEGEQ